MNPRLLVFTALIALVGCKTDPPVFEYVDPFAYPVPETYDFENVSFSGQTERQDQLGELSAYIATAETKGVEISETVMRDMYANTNGDGNGNFSFSSTKDLKSKTFESDQSLIESYFERAAQASKSDTEGSNGQAGVVVSNDGSKAYLCDANGWDMKQLIEKCLMGAVFYYQIAEVYTSDAKMDVDNTDIEVGKGTAMQHHWDEAFGYFGVTTNFPNDLENIRYWGKYSNGRDALLGTNTQAIEAFARGRAAIDAADYATRDEAREDVREVVEVISAATAIHYFNSTINNFSDDALRNHALSEAYMFVHNLKYNSERRITLDEIDTIKALIGDNLYECTISNLTTARDQLATIYGLENVKTQL